jgi:isoleucyl-tRNA synthetase
VRAKVTETLEPLRQAGTIGKSLDAVVTVAARTKPPPGCWKNTADFYPNSLSFQLSVSHAGTGAVPTARHAKEAGHTRCPRCWRWVPKVVHTAHGEVCPRCAEALNS